jgi:hypothetical protein
LLCAEKDLDAGRKNYMPPVADEPAGDSLAIGLQRRPESLLIFRAAATKITQPVI